MTGLFDADGDVVQGVGCVDWQVPEVCHWVAEAFPFDLMGVVVYDDNIFLAEQSSISVFADLSDGDKGTFEGWDNMCLCGAPWECRMG